MYNNKECFFASKGIKISQKGETALCNDMIYYFGIGSFLNYDI